MPKVEENHTTETRETGNIIELKDVTKRFPGVVALDQVDLTITKGESRALVGENGAGKTTLVKTLTREYIQDEGEIFLKGEKIQTENPWEAQEKGIRVVPQELNLVPVFSVAQNILLGQEPVGRMLRMNKEQLYEDAARYLRLVTDQLDPRLQVEKLSVAEKQIVSIARALSTDPSVLILDEPTARLDREKAEALFSILDDLKARQEVVLIYITHHLQEIFEVAESVTVLRNGKKVGTHPVRSIDEEELTSLMVGEKVKKKVPKEEVDIGKTKLKVKDINVSEETNGEFSFRLREGEILGIVGMVGAKKTDVAKTLFGEINDPSLTVLLEGNEVNLASPKAAINSGFAYVPEERVEEGLIPLGSITENITLANLKKFISLHFWLNRSKEKEEVQRIVEKLQIVARNIRQWTRSLSGGNQQKVVLGRWINSEAEIFIADEVTKGIDVGAKTEVYRVINNLAKNKKGIIFITHEIDEALSFCDRLLVLHKGKLAKKLSPQETNYEEVLRYTLGGGSFRG